MKSDDAIEFIENLKQIYTDWQPSDVETGIRIKKLYYYELTDVETALEQYMNTPEGDYRRPKFYKIIKFADKLKAERRRNLKNCDDSEPVVLFSIKCVAGKKQGQVSKFAISQRRRIPDVEVICQQAERWIERLKGMYLNSDYIYTLRDTDAEQKSKTRLTAEQRMAVETNILDGEDAPGKRFLMEVNRRKPLASQAVKDVKGKYEKDYDNELTST